MVKSGTNMVYEYPENSKAIRLKQHEAALAAAKEDDKLSPETGKPISKSNMIKFGVAFLVFGVLWMVGINAIAAFIIPLRLKELVSNPAAVLSINGIVSSICSLVANFVFGNLSDRTRSKFGRRTPWLIVGSIVGGVFMFLTGIAPNATLIVIYYGLAMVGLNIMIAPFVAMLSDRIPKNIRGTMSACYGAGSTIGGPLGTLLASQLVNNVTLSSILAGLFMLASGIVVVLIIPREPSADYLPKPKGDWKDLLVSFRPPKFKENHDFYKAFAGRLCMLMAYQMIVAYQLYIVTDYVGLKTGPAAQVISIMSIITMVVSLIGPAISGPLSDITGRRKLPVLIASILFALGIAFPWFFPSAMGMYAYAAIAGLGYGVYSSVDQALNVDVLHNSPSAGKDLGFLNLATTIGQMLGPVVTASIVTATGGYALAFTVSIVAAVLGSVFVMGIKGVK
jgi:MFS family permease